VGEFRKAVDLLEEKNTGSPLYSLVNVWYSLLDIDEVIDKNKL
jgi:hypothetical protein